MKKIDKRIEIVSSTFKLSSMSRKSRLAAFEVLNKHYTSVRITIVNTLADLEALASRQPDLVFLGMKFVPKNEALGLNDPDKIWVAGYLETHNIAHTGSGQSAHEMEQNKDWAKQRLLDTGLRTAAFCVAKQNEKLTEEAITPRYPLFVKPTNRGGGIGIDYDSVVYNFTELKAKVDSITNGLHSDALIEEYLPGREISVAILKNEDSDDYTIMPLERVAPPDENGVRILCPQIKEADAGLSVTVTDKVLKTKVAELAIGAFQALGGRDYGRVDIRLDAQGEPHFLEANLIPSIIAGYGNFAKACVINEGLEYEPMLLRMVRLGLARQLELGSSSESDNNEIIVSAPETALDPA